MISYSETIDFLYNQLPTFQSLGPGAYKPGLGNAIMLDNAFGNCHRRFKTIHVAGTNGKGSVSHSIASVLQGRGYKVGLYTSPHLVDFRERIKVNGDMIPEPCVQDFVQRFIDMKLDCQPSFFELTTIMAFEYFARMHVDYAVIETGLGGRLDTTNIINPELCVITNVSLDHMALLGNTEPEIAYEKAGIIKQGVPVVIGEAQGEVRKVFEQAAAEKDAPIVFACDTPVDCVEESGLTAYIRHKGEPACIFSDLQGDFQLLNVNTVLHAFDFIPGFSSADLSYGLSSVKQTTGLRGRWMTVMQHPTVVCDTGHNIGAWRHLAPKLAQIAGRQRLRVVVGFAADKDSEAIFDLLPKNADYYLVAPAVKRARAAGSLLSMAEARALKAAACPSVEQGYRQALSDSAPTDFIFVGGSNYVVGEFLSCLSRKE